MDWLVESTEKFCKDKAVYNAIMESIHIIDGKSKRKQKMLFLKFCRMHFLYLLMHTLVTTTSLMLMLDSSFIIRVETRVPFDLEYFNIITNGGTPQKL